jgi:deoxyribonuclease-4
MKTSRQFGAHVSIAGGLHTAFERAVAAGCDCMQVFIKNQRQWRAKPIDADAVAAWNAARKQAGIATVVAHDAYLINLAAPQDSIWHTSIDAFYDELTRCRQVGIRWLVAHPGSHSGTGEAAGVKRVAAALDIIYDRLGNDDVITLLEVTAGQGTNLGYRFEHLADIMAAVESKVPLGICLDTCHLFAAGYDISTDEGYEQTVAAMKATVGTNAVRCIHMNDSKKPLGSRVDRHEHIGKGEIGRSAFRRFINDPRFAGVPMILETPKETDARGRDMDRVNLAVLRRLVDEPGRKLDSRAHPGSE